MVAASWESGLLGECQIQGKVVLRSFLQKNKILDFETWI
jgi:hypothetical protein